MNEYLNDKVCKKKIRECLFHFSNSLAGSHNKEVEHHSVNVEEEAIVGEIRNELLVSEHIEEHEATVEDAGDASKTSNGPECGDLPECAILEDIVSEFRERG